MPKVKQKCEWCNIEFKCYQSDNRKFCSKECFYEYKKTLEGEKSKKYSQVESICNECEKPFKKFKSSKKKFCSTECYYEYRKKNKIEKAKKCEVICQSCGKIFYVYPYREKTAKYCSRECNKNQVTVSCENCGSNFSMKKVKANEHKIHFCSTECQINYGTLLTICQYCGDEFRAQRSLVEKRIKKYCSKDCHSRWMSENLTGEKRYNWTGGTKPYPKEFNDRFKTKIRERDDYICQICNKEQSYSVHHINYDKQDTTETNCITLCRSCHTKTNSSRDKWQMLLQMLQIQRGVYREREV